MRRSLLALTVASVALAACASPPGEGENNANNADQNACTGGKCDDSTERDLFAELDGRREVIADFLRANAYEDGTIEGDYRTFLDGVGEEMGCDESTEKTFIILMSKNDHFPRNISTRCSDQPDVASTFFLSTQSDYGDRDDINPRDFKMFAWDDGQKKYNLYEAKDDGTGEGPLHVDVEPDHCFTCHTEPANLSAKDMPFTPIMNELTNPWTLWNAEPDFESHRFDGLIDPTVREAPVYTEMTGGEKLGSAADFETLIRASIDRVVNARLRVRREDADLDKALGLLRPMFCDETANYASERHDSGEVATAIVIDDAIRQMYLSIRPDDWPYDWLNDRRMSLASLENGEEPLAVMPVRGEATLQVEVGLVARRAFTAEEVLRVRALDWKRPVFSDFRCDLFGKGAERLRANPPDMEDYSRVSSLLPVVYDELMKLEVTDPETGEPVLWDIRPPDGKLYSIPDAEDPAIQETLTYGLFEEFETDLDGFATELEAWFDRAQEPGRRPELEAERQRRGCIAQANIPSAPKVPDIDCDTP